MALAIKVSKNEWPHTGQSEANNSLGYCEANLRRKWRIEKKKKMEENAREKKQEKKKADNESKKESKIKKI